MYGKRLFLLSAVALVCLLQPERAEAGFFSAIWDVFTGGDDTPTDHKGGKGNARPLSLIPAGARLAAKAPEVAPGFGIAARPRQGPAVPKGIWSAPRARTDSAGAAVPGARMGHVPKFGVAARPPAHASIKGRVNSAPRFNAPGGAVRRARHFRVRKGKSSPRHRRPRTAYRRPRSFRRRRSAAAAARNVSRRNSGHFLNRVPKHAGKFAARGSDLSPARGVPRKGSDYSVSGLPGRGGERKSPIRRRGGSRGRSSHFNKSVTAPKGRASRGGERSGHFISGVPTPAKAVAARGGDRKRPSGSASRQRPGGFISGVPNPTGVSAARAGGRKAPHHDDSRKSSGPFISGVPTPTYVPADHRRVPGGFISGVPTPTKPADVLSIGIASPGLKVGDVPAAAPGPSGLVPAALKTGDAAAAA